MRIAYFTLAAGMILCAMMIELHVEFRNRLQTLIDRAYEQDGNFHDRLREVYEIAMHPPRQEALRWAHMHTLLFTVANSPQTAADQHN